MHRSGVSHDRGFCKLSEGSKKLFFLFSTEKERFLKYFKFFQGQRFDFLILNDAGLGQNCNIRSGDEGGAFQR